MTGPKSILLLRADAIGDHVLASGLIPLLRARWPETVVTVLCPALVADLFRSCPMVDRVIAFDPRRVKRKKQELMLRWALRHRFDLAINTVFSRDLLVDSLARRVRAKRFVAFKGDTSNQSAALLRRHDSAYTELVDAPEAPLHALDKLDLMARHLGLDGTVEPAVWLTRDDHEAAERVFRENNLSPDSTLAFFPGSGTPIRLYPGYGSALGGFLAARSAKVVALGSAADAPLAAGFLQDLPGSGHVNLCGRTGLREAAALLARCRLAMGAESGLAHLAWAVGTPQAVVVGGGHFGSFLPRSPITTTACLPMECFGCNWDCRFDRPHCIQDLPPEVLMQAMIEAWDGPSALPRVFHPEPSTSPQGHAASIPPLPGGTAILASKVLVRDPARTQA